MYGEHNLVSFERVIPSNYGYIAVLAGSKEASTGEKTILPVIQDIHTFLLAMVNHGWAH